MRENKYDGPVFFEKYSRTSRSTPGLERAGEWEALGALTACLEPLLKESAVSLTERRYQKFRALGRGKEDT